MSATQTRDTADTSLDRSPLPSVWAVMGYRAGERSQILALAEALNWPFEIKELSYKSYDFVPGLLRLSTATGIDMDKSTPLTPPWPDLIISAGMRNEPVCKWIKDQSGGRTRIVHLGRPWTRLEYYDLVITTPQYRLPSRPNVLQNTTTLHRVSEKRLASAQRLWAPRLKHLPSPYIAVVVGGNSGPYTLGRKAATRLAHEAQSMARACGGSLLVTTSARTSTRATDALEKSISCPHQLFRWAPGATDNPYFGFLALADAIIVTGDSISMLTEACATRKPVYIFDLGSGTNAMRSPPSHGNNVESYEHNAAGQDFRLGALLYKQLMRFAPRRLSRDIRLVHRQLVASGHAVWIGDTHPESQAPAKLGDIENAVSRVHALVKQDRMKAGQAESA